jgi:hypothetical protein
MVLNKLNRINKSLRSSKRNSISSTELDRLKKGKSELVDSEKFMREQVNNGQRVVNTLNNSKPFLIGPATVDSLFNQEPENWRYIREGRLPFDLMFIDFVQPFRIGIPFIMNESDLVGVLLSRGNFSFTTDNLDLGIGHGLEYSLSTYDSGKGEQLIRGNSILFGQPNTLGGTFKMYCRTTISSKDGVGYDKHIMISPENQRARIITFSESMNHDPKDFRDEDVFLRLESGEFDEELTLDKIPNSHLFSQLPNFCVNFVNYINAHNVTVKQRTRGRYIPYDGQDVARLPSKKRPFYLITIKDDVVEEPQQRQARTWDLQWRVYVRGHDRRYRDDSGQIVKTTWVRPHIRGPPEAPWKENRYEVLAAKLGREEDMYRQHGIED